MIVITGGSGFVGNALIQRLVATDDAVPILAPVRNFSNNFPPSVKQYKIANIESTTNWDSILVGVSTVVHCAARVHVMNDTEPDPLLAFQRVNVDGTINLARQAARAGVQRFIFLSSIKVNGEVTVAGHPFLPDDKPAPSDPYGLSKLQAEEGLRKIALETGMELVIIRPPLVYGPGVKANFNSMLKLVASGLPLPFGAINNSRSLVSLDNLVDFLIVCIRQTEAAGHVFLVSDGEDVSTTDLILMVARVMNRRAILLPINVKWLEAFANFIGKRSLIQRLCSNLQVDIDKNYRILGWQPAISLELGLKKTVGGFKK